MSSAKDKQDRIRERIAASQDRLTRESEVLPALPPRKAPAQRQKRAPISVYKAVQGLENERSNVGCKLDMNASTALV